MLEGTDAGLLRQPRHPVRSSQEKREREREDEIAQKAFLLTFAQKDF